MAKKKKEKIIYIDDGRTIADMSNVKPSATRRMMGHGTVSSPKEIWHTYWDAVRMMFRPMLVAAGGLIIVFLLLYLIFSVI